MTKRKKTKKAKNSKGWFSFLKRDGKKKSAAKPAPRKRKKKDAPRIGPSLRITLTIAGFALLAASLTAGFMVMERFVKTLPQAESRTGPLKLIDPPFWLGQAWVDHLIQTLGDSRFSLDESTADAVSEKVKQIAWLSDVRVRVTPAHVEIAASYRRPLVSAAMGGRRYYVDDKMIIFNALPVTKIAVPEVIGFTQRSAPSPGTVWLAEDVRAAMELARALASMDQLMAAAEDPITKPLLDEIAGIDVSNFSGRQSTAQPHLVLNVKDSETKVHWGAAWGQAARLMEADEKEKVATLYQFYVENGHTLKGIAKFIDLTQPRSLVPRL